MDLNSIIQALQTMSQRIDQHLGLQNTPTSQGGYPVITDPDGYQRLYSSKLPAVGKYNDSQGMTPYDYLQYLHPGLLAAWNHEAAINKQPLPDVDTLLKQYHDMLQTRPRHYQGDL